MGTITARRGQVIALVFGIIAILATSTVIKSALVDGGHRAGLYLLTLVVAVAIGAAAWAPMPSITSAKRTGREWAVTVTAGIGAVAYALVALLALANNNGEAQPVSSLLRFTALVLVGVALLIRAYDDEPW